MSYNVFGGTLNLTESNPMFSRLYLVLHAEPPPVASEIILCTDNSRKVPITIELTRCYGEWDASLSSSV